MSNLITVDWGTSNFRATLFDKHLNIIDSLSTNNGILNIKNNDFYSFLSNILSSWLEAYSNPTIIISGMIGSVNGWVQTDYCLCNTSIGDITKKLVKIPDLKENIYIVPGVKYKNDLYIDLMRGEEIQIFGALQITNKKDAFIILPGSHSKWSNVRNNSIESFRTNMTGEVFKVISENTILEKSISSKKLNTSTFIEGVIYSKKDGGLLSQIFQARAQASTIKEENIYSFLSGIIIGNEIKEMLKVFKCNEVTTVASSTLNELYKIALNEYQINANTVLSDTATNEAMKYIYKKIKEKQNV